MMTSCCHHFCRSYAWQQPQRTVLWKTGGFFLLSVCFDQCPDLQGRAGNLLFSGGHPGKLVSVGV